MKFVFFFIFSFSFIFETKASNSINGKEIEDLVNTWLEKNNHSGNVEILDSIKYPFCEKNDILITDISGSFNLIKISCLQPNEWNIITRNKTKNKKLYGLKEKGKKKFNVITLKSSKSAGSTINEDDLISVKKSIVIKDNLVEEKSNIVGKKLKNSISSGRALYHSNFEKDWLIEKNSIIIIENKVGGITIKEEGVALNNADFMGKIRVKNIKSGKIIDGYAKNEKKVVLKTKQN
ncbi:MAG: flagella basal body P-ring formation protein FlgA [Rickettsiales bacterium]|nr:flagella basal body P-ring formation protein FlgA [Rickettsiales bacterium]|tara:strand:- start:1491 stop:2195 length:705 start_codon:yes stop_codon:yes gene_type:complete